MSALDIRGVSLWSIDTHIAHCLCSLVSAGTAIVQGGGGETLGKTAVVQGGGGERLGKTAAEVCLSHALPRVNSRTWNPPQSSVALRAITLQGGIHNASW